MSLAAPSPHHRQLTFVLAPALGSAVAHIAGCDLATTVAAGALAFLASRIVHSDYRRRLISHADLAGFAAAGFGWVLCSSPDPMWDLLRGAIHSCAYGIGFEAIGRLYRRIRGRSGMGPADVKLAAAMGPILDLEAFGLAILGAAVLGLGLVAGRWLIKGRKPGRYTYLPFGAVLVIAGYVVWLAGRASGSWG